jgi:glycosyltransferase involved in cell wall biosynthesis
MNRQPTIDIVLATYNGERYLEEQIQSILNQTHPHWRLIIRDDGSTDSTPTIIRNYTEKYPDNIVAIDDSLHNLGACGNFGKLLEHATADYVMFSDQDDVWLPHKIELTFQKMDAMEKIHGRDMPLLVYTDMRVVDNNLSIIADSFWRHQVFNPNIGRSLSRFLVSNVATGCTVMINRKLRDFATPLPQEAMMHDWWVGLVSAALGKNDYLDEATVLYRQHASNVAGAKWKLTIETLIEKLMHFNELKRINREHLLRTQRQALSFATRFKAFLNTNDYRKIMVYATLSEQSFLYKRVALLRYGFWWAGFVRSAVMFLII